MIYLMFDGRCKEALGLYEKAFGAKILELKQYKDTNNPSFPVEEHQMEWVLNSHMDIFGMLVMAADAPSRSSSGDNMLVHIMPKTVEEAERAWEALLEEGSKVFMKPTQTFFAKFHASIKDKYGVNWMFTVTQDYVG